MSVVPSHNDSLMNVNDATPSNTRDVEDDGEIADLLRASNLYPFPSREVLKNMTKLDLSNAGITSLPDSLPQVLPALSILFASNNYITAFPSVLSQCQQLRMIAFKSNQMNAVPSNSFPVATLQWLILTNNLIAHLPADDIKQCSKLQKLMLSGNQLSQLPASISQCRSLELVRLASNNLQEPPMELLQLPNLAWIALSNNPFLDGSNMSVRPKLPAIAIQELDTKGAVELGRGAGGITKRMEWTRTSDLSDAMAAQRFFVAVKEYNSEMTSDGNPQEERYINTLISSSLSTSDDSSCFIKVFGETADGESEGREGYPSALVMEYLDSYCTLADPPSFVSCTRDVYRSFPHASGVSDNSPDQIVHQWTRQEVHYAVSQLLFAMCHLHKLGITHGDFYAHNILVKKSGKALGSLDVKLSDFGAAFLYEKSSEHGQLLEAIEVRAFGILLKEIADHVLLIDQGDGADESGTNPEMKRNASFRQVLRDVASKCWCPEADGDSESRQLVRSFAELEIYWNQQALQMLSQAFADDADFMPPGE
jgi:Leucine rich repeat/Protein kinase domain